MDIATMITNVKSHPDFSKAGMVLCHNGVVREHSRDGRLVSGLEVRVNHDKLAGILAEKRAIEGIVDIRVHIEENKKLLVGDDVMFLVVAGDIRENVIQTLSETLDLIKRDATEKTQYFI